MRRPEAIAVVIVLFLLGVAVGALGANLLDHRHGWPGGHGGGGLGLRPAQGHSPGHSMVAELHRRLGLTADQQRQLDAIVADTHRETMAMWHQMRERLSDRIQQILTPQQRAEFQRYRQELEAERQRRQQARIR